MATGFGVFKSSNFGRIDQGVDFVGSGPIPALDKGVVTYVGSSSIIQGGTYPVVVYKLTHGPYRGRFVYVAENFSPGVKVGQHLKQGDSIGYAQGSSPYIEVGFNQSAQGWNAYGSPSDRNSPQGTAMSRYINGLIGAAPPVRNAAAGGTTVDLNPVTGAIGAITGTAGDVASSVASPFTDLASAIGFIFSVRGLQTMGGGILVLMGLYLLARQVGLNANPVAAVLPDQGKKAADEAAAQARQLKIEQDTERRQQAAEKHEAHLEVQSARADNLRARTETTRTKREPRTVHQYYLDTPPTTRRQQIAAKSTYDPETSDIGF